MISSYFSVDNILTPAECQAIIDYCTDKCKTSNLTYKHVQDKEIRNSVNTFLSQEDLTKLPMIKKVIDCVVKVSAECFKFPIGTVEVMQYAEYSEGMYYEEHCDCGATLDNDRDISVSVFLSPRDDYQGGNLCFRERGNYYKEFNEKQGTVVIFSSMLYHKVKKVESGKRSSLVLWCKRPDLPVEKV